MADQGGNGGCGGNCQRVGLIDLLPKEIFLSYVIHSALHQGGLLMATLNVRLDIALKQQAYAVLEQLNISPSEAIRLYFQYITDNHSLPIKSVVVTDEEQDLLEKVRYRLANPQKGIKVNLDEL
jgi:addiction module antitoxin, relB/dinJ family